MVPAKRQKMGWDDSDLGPHKQNRPHDKDKERGFQNEKIHHHDYVPTLYRARSELGQTKHNTQDGLTEQCLSCTDCIWPAMDGLHEFCFWGNVSCSSSKTSSYTAMKHNKQWITHSQGQEMLPAKSDKMRRDDSDLGTHQQNRPPNKHK